MSLRRNLSYSALSSFESFPVDEFEHFDGETGRYRITHSVLLTLGVGFRQLSILLPDNVIAFTGDRFEFAPVCDFHLALTVVDHALSLEFLYDGIHSSPPCS